jgi:hypothetical protein
MFRKVFALILLVYPKSLHLPIAQKFVVMSVKEFIATPTYTKRMVLLENKAVGYSYR